MYVQKYGYMDQLNPTFKYVPITPQMGPNNSTSHNSLPSYSQTCMNVAIHESHHIKQSYW